MENIETEQNEITDSAAPTRQPINLLRATTTSTAEGQQQQQQAAATRLAISNSRSALRMRVTSSRLRVAPTSALTASPRVAPGSAVVSESSGQVAPSSGVQRGLRPTKSRSLRPSLLKPSLASSASEASGAASPDQPVTGSPVVQPTRQTKPRFVVVTRTGQFGIRASAISAAAAAAASASSAAAATSGGSATNDQPSVASSIDLAPSTTQLLRPASKFVNRFQKSQLAARASQAASQAVSQLVATSGGIEPTQANSSPAQATRLADNSDLNTPTLPPFDSSDIRRPVGSTTTTSTTNQPPVNENVGQPENNNMPVGMQIDGSSSVVVTYYTTTTHTIPFVMSSQTIFTTLEETNTRTATEHVRDLGNHFIKPTASFDSEIPRIQATARPEDATQPQQQPVTTTTTTNQPPVTTDSNLNGATPPIDPSFVVSLNTRTLFTTFTFFTTFAAEGGSATPTVVSSESTTSQIVTETVTSVYDQTKALETPTAGFDGRPAVEPTSISSMDIQSSMATSEIIAPTIQASSVGMDEIQPTAPITQTLVSTMTYYGTVYNGTQTSLTPIVDVSTQLLTLTSPGFNLNSDALAAAGGNSQSIAPTAAPSTNGEIQPSTAVSTGADARQQPQTISLQDSNVQPTEVVNDPNKVTRTRSLYTTLTHFITFYSGTKTQLSTIQEISPTVVTEYIDKTLFEQQQQEAAAAAGSSSVVVVPANDASSMANVPIMTLTPSPVLPMMSSTSLPATTTTTTTTTTNDVASSNSEPQTTTAGSGVGSSNADSSDPSDNLTSSSSTSTTTAATTTPTTTTPTTTTTTTTTPKPELESAQASKPNGGAISSDNQSADARVLPSTDETGGQGSATPSPNDGKSSTNIIELSDLIAANSSQSGRVALAGNLGAAIKDIVQLLAGNKTNTISPLVNLPGSSQSTPEPTSESDVASPSQQTTTTASTSTTSTSTTTTNPQTRQRAPTRVFGNKAKEQQQQQQLQNLQGSMTSPSIVSTSVPSVDAPASSVQARGTPEMVITSVNSVRSTQQQQQQQPAATIFFGDDGGDERKKQVKTAWSGAQSTVYVTSIEPSTRMLTLTTTKVYYTRDAPMTITSSYTTVIAPRTFVSTIMGTRTLVNQLNTQAPPIDARTTPKPVTPSTEKPTQPSRQESAASGHRLTAQLKQQKQQAQEEAVQKKVKAQEQAKREQQAAIAAAKARAIAAAAAIKDAPGAGQNANINQCQPMCKLSNNEICKFTPNSDTIGAQGTFGCACRPGYYMMLNNAGQRSCQEIQSYVVLLRLLQIGDQPVSFKRELQDRSSQEYKQYSRIIKDHVKRAYMTSELTRDRFVSADILNYARSLSLQPGASTATSSAAAQPTGGRQPVAVSKSQLGDPLNAGLIVNITVQLQPPAPNANEILDENTLKEELTKKLNMRQAAALAAAAAAAAAGGSTSRPEAEVAVPVSGEANSTVASGSGINTTTAEVEMLPNPNALFLADVEQVTDLDECANPALNDCHEGAVCINEPGSYRCDCREYPDLNPLHPGRQCASELKSCDYCNNRGDCVRVPSLLPATSSQHLPSTAHNSSSSSQLPLGNGRGQAFSTVCQCHRIYLGRRCEINGLLLATLLPIVAILLIVSVCLAVYCCRRWRKRSALSKGFRNIGTFGPNIIGGTLDRKAMLESSSESSDTHQRTHHHNHHHHLRNGANGIYDTHGGLPVSIVIGQHLDDRYFTCLKAKTKSLSFPLQKQQTV